MTRPRWHTDHELLAAVANRLHAQRVAGYPELVAAGTLSQAKADAGIRVIGAIAAGWSAIARLELEPADLYNGDAGGAWPSERVAALSVAARAARTKADELASDFEIVGFADAVDTLIWWETAQPDARWIADFNRLARSIYGAAADEQRRERDARAAAKTQPPGRRGAPPAPPSSNDLFVQGVAA